MSSTLPGGGINSESEEIPFAEMAEALLSRLGLEDIGRTPEAVDAVLDEGYIFMRLGAFELWFPRYALCRKDGVRDFKDVLTTLLKMQGKWLDWICSEKSASMCRKERRTLDKWIKNIRMRKCKAAGYPEEGRPEITRLLKASKEVMAASDAFAGYMTQCAFLGKTDKTIPFVTIVISPDRREFLELGSFHGLLGKEHEIYFWNNSFPLWTYYTWRGKTVIALESPANSPGKGDITKGLRLDAREQTGMLQHVAQHAMKQFINTCFGRRLQKDIADGLAMNMVIDLYGKNNVRSGGGTKAGISAAPSRFYIGNTGPTKAKLNSLWFDTRWRKTQGADHFIKSLQLAQSRANKEVKKKHEKKFQKNRCFAIEPDKGGIKYHLIQAPLLAASRHKGKVPFSYNDDYLEFHRAFRCAFTHWLQQGAMVTAGKKEADDRFRRLLLNAANISGTATKSGFNQIVKDLYGKPLSSEDGSGSLENDFLDWLARG